MNIVVPDLGLSNLWSALRALETLGHEAVATARPVEVAAAETILLPGVGAFAEASRRLQQTGLGNAIRSAGRSPMEARLAQKEPGLANPQKAAAEDKLGSSNSIRRPVAPSIQHSSRTLE